MRVLKIAVVMSSVLVAAACGDRQAQSRQETAADLAWLDSLALYPQTAPAVASPMEMGMAPAEEPEAEPARAVSSVSKARSTRSAAPAKRARRSSSSGGSGDYAGSSGPVRQPRVVTVKNTKRDAAIGAASGAVIGAVAGGSRHRVRNAAIGAVAGGVLGAVIGSTVDVKKRVEY